MWNQIVSLALFAILVSRASASTDHLLPIEKGLLDDHGTFGAYNRVWRKQLEVSPRDVVTYVSWPSLIGEETAVSLFRLPEQKGYLVKYRKASKAIWNYFAPAGQPPSKSPYDVPIVKLQAVLPQSAGDQVHKVWLVMVRGAKPVPPGRDVYGEATSDFLFVTDQRGKQLRAQAPRDGGKNIKALLELENWLQLYCEVPPAERTKWAKKIERDADALLHRGSR
jgi:hypothetical protein